MSLELIASPETKRLVEALRAVPLGDEITYRSLSEEIGRDVTQQAKGKLNSARRIADRDHGAVFEPIRGVGLRRLTAEEAHRVGAAARCSIRRKANRSVSTMKSMLEHTNGLDAQSAKKASSEIAMNALVSQLVADNNSAAASSASEPDQPAPPARVAQAFLTHIGATPAPTE